MTIATVIDGVEELKALEGTELGVSAWETVDQQMITEFARITKDEQWIHVDTARAVAGPFGTTIAHGYLILSLIPHLANQTYEIRGFAARVNYGLENVRFLSPLQSGKRLRNRVRLSNVTETDKGVRLTFSHRLEAENSDRPVCIANTIVLFTE